MKILGDDQVPALPETQTWREPAWSDLIWGAIWALLALGCAAAPYLPWTSEIPAWLAWPVAALLGFLARLCLVGYRGSRAPEGWILRWLPDGLYLRYRSFRNRQFPPDTPSVFFLPRREIHAIRPYRETLVTIDDEGDRRRRKRRGIEIVLKDVDTAALAEALKAEQRQRGPRGGRFNHSPVTLSPEGNLFLELRRDAAALDAIGRYFPLQGKQPETIRDPKRMSAAQQEDHILDLLLAGDRMGAVRVARRYRGCSLSEAKQLVDTLIER